MFNPRFPRFFNWPALVWLMPVIGATIGAIYKAGVLSDKLDTVTASSERIEHRLDDDEKDRKEISIAVNTMKGQLEVLVHAKTTVASNH